MARVAISAFLAINVPGEQSTARRRRCARCVWSPLLCSVKTSREIDKARISDAIARVKVLRVKAPISAGQVIDADLASTGAALVATASVEGV